MIFVDTSFWVAWLNRRDAHHGEAATIAMERADSGWVTSNHVAGETWTFLRRRGGHAAAVAFLDAVEQSTRVEVIMIDETAERSALGWLRRHDEREYSFVDATSFALMRREGIREAFAFDGDFAAAGFTELRSSGGS